MRSSLVNIGLSLRSLIYEMTLVAVCRRPPASQRRSYASGISHEEFQGISARSILLPRGARLRYCPHLQEDLLMVAPLHVRVDI